MKKKIEYNLKNAVEKITPDVYDAIRRECSFDTASQAVSPFPVTQRKTRRAGFLPALVGCAAISAVCLGGIQWNNYLRPVTTLSMDVNPSVSLVLNRKNKVLRVTPENQDGMSILDNMDLTGVDGEIAVNALVGSMVKQGYLNENENSVLISVVGTAREIEEDLRTRVRHSVRQVFSENHFVGAVITQTLSATDEEIATLAKDHQVSAGKAALARNLAAQSPNLPVGDIIELSVNDINLLLSSGSYPLPDVCIQGTASSNGYISNETALELALENSGLRPEEVQHTTITTSYSGGHISWEVEFYHDSNKYEYDFDAATGELLEWEIEWKNEELFAIEMEELERSKTVEGIGEENAIAAACEHSGVKVENLLYVEAIPTYENGTEFYEVDFRTETNRYEYHIDAHSGGVLEYTHK